MTTNDDPRPNAPGSGDLEELATLYAAGALPADEAAAVEARLEAGDAELVAALAAYASTVEAMVESTPPVEPDSSIKAALFARIGVEMPEPAEEPAASGAPEAFVSRGTTSEWMPRQVHGQVVEGVQVRILWVDEARNRVTALLKMEAGATYPAHVHKESEHFYVMEGDLTVGPDTYGAGDYVRFPPGSLHEPHQTQDGCTCFVVTSLENEYV